jgi:hypothetical protein
MSDFAAPNLPARDFSATEEFYRMLGFEPVFRDSGWMVMRRGTAQLEFSAVQPWGRRMAELVDLNGTLVHLIEER